MKTIAQAIADNGGSGGGSDIVYVHTTLEDTIREPFVSLSITECDATPQEVADYFNDGKTVRMVIHEETSGESSSTTDFMLDLSSINDFGDDKDVTFFGSLYPVYSEIDSTLHIQFIAVRGSVVEGWMQAVGTLL